MDKPAIQKAKLVQLLADGSLRELVRWLDIECNASEDEDGLAIQALVRGVIALGYEILQNNNYPTVRQTICSAEEYALAPSESHLNALFHDSSMSYPFGPGEGCYSMEPGNCEIGTGCSSGAGTLACQEVPEERIMQLLSIELLPWLDGTDDPVISRNQ